MFKRHTYTFGFRRFSVAEKRLIFDDAAPEKKKENTPDALLGDGSSTPLHEVMRTNEQQRVHWAEIEKVLRQAVEGSGNTELQKMWESKEIRKWIIAQVVTDPDDGFRTWLTRAAQGYAEQYENTATKEKDRLVQVNQDVSEKVQKLVKKMGDLVDTVKKHRDAKGSGEPLPITGDEMNEILRILDSLGTFEDIKAKQHALIEVARVILSTEEKQGKKHILSALKKNKKSLGGTLHSTLETSLTQILDDTKIHDYEDRKAKMIDELITYASVDFTEEDRKKLEQMILTLETGIAELNREEDRLVEDALEHHTRHMRFFAGDDRSALLRSALRDDYKMDTDFLKQKLKILNAKLTDAEIDELIAKLPNSYKVSKEAVRVVIDDYSLTIQNIQDLVTPILNTLPQQIQQAFNALVQAGDKEGIVKMGMEILLKTLLTNGKEKFIQDYDAVIQKAEEIFGDEFDVDTFLDQLVTAWSIDGTEADTYMKDTLHLDDPSVLAFNKSFRRLLLRSRLTPEVADFMIKGDMQIYLSDLIQLSSLDTFTDAAGTISKDTAEKVIDMISEEEGGQKRFDANRFIDVLSFIYLKKAGANEKEQVATARFDAATLLNDLVTANKITPDAGDKITLESYDKSNSVSVDSRFIIPNEDDLRDELMTKDAGDKAIDFQSTLNGQHLDDYKWHEVTKVYLGAILKDSETVGTSFIEVAKEFGWNVIHTPQQHEKIILQRDRLNGIKDALEAALAMSEGSDVMVKDAIEKLKSIRTDAERLAKPLSSTVDINETLKQAKYLAEANLYVITALRNEDLWDEMPDPVRKASLWIAMNQGEDPEEGLRKAKEFIREYMRSPDALHYYEQAFNAYIAAPTDENLAKYKRSVFDFKSASRIDTATVDTYIAAIDTYHEALTKWDSNMVVGTVVEAIDSAGKKVEGTVTAIEPTKKNPKDEDLVSVTLDTKGKKTVDAWIHLDDARKFYIERTASKQHADAATAFRTAAESQNTLLDPRDPRSTAHQLFFNNFVAGLSPDDNIAFRRYLRKIETVKEIEGGNILDSAFHRHKLFIKPAAIYALATKTTDVTHNGATLEDVGLSNGSFSMDRWLNEGHRKFADEPLRLIVDGPVEAREALIRAYVDREDVEYPSKDEAGMPIMKTMTAAEAFTIVSHIKETLQWQSEQQQPSFEVLGQDELFKDPIESSFRGILESMQDMWAGDWVDKGKVVLGVVAAVWLIRHIWQKGSDPDSPGILKLAKYAVVGLPILMVANSAYKARTGRDILGEKLLYMSKAKREGILEQWRRRSLEYGDERYAVLGHPAGFAAMQELMRKEDPVSIKDLHEWRMNVKNGGFNDYLSGKPDNLDIFEIQSRLGINASEEEAAKVAFLAYEALCVDVAALHSMDSGDLRSRANWGSDYLFQEYHQALSYRDVPADATGKTSLQELLQRRGMGMMDVMLMEAQLAASKNNIDKHLTTMERIATFTGQSVEWVQSLVGRAKVMGEVAIDKAKKSVPEFYKGVTDWATATYEEVEMWLRKKYPYMEKATVDAFSGFLTSMKEFGISVIEVAPHVLEFGYDRAVDGVNIGGRALEEIGKFHDYLLTNPELREWIRPFELSVARTFGVELAELNKEKAKEQIQTELAAMVSFYDGSNYPIHDVLRPASTISAMEQYRRNQSLIFTNAAGTPITSTEAEAQIRAWADQFAPRAFGAGTTFDAVDPVEQRYLLELVQARIFESIAKEAEGPGGVLFDQKEKYETDKAVMQQAVRAAELDVTSKKTIRNATEKNLTDARKAESKKQALEDERNGLNAEDIQLTNEFRTATPARRTEITNRKRDIASRIAEIGVQLPALQSQIAAIPGLETDLVNQSGDLATAETTLENARLALEQFLEDGLNAPAYQAKIPFASLIAAGADSTILTPSYAGAPRKPNLFQNVFDQDRTIFYYVKLNAMLGDADYVAFKSQMEAWKQNRLDYDPAYQKDLKDTSTDPLIRASYIRYLEQVALGEAFLRALMETPKKDTEEHQRPLYLSMKEARFIDQYLEERERLVTFAQFKKLYQSLEADHRP